MPTSQLQYQLSRGGKKYGFSTVARWKPHVNLIKRKILTETIVTNIMLQIYIPMYCSSSRVSYRFHLAHCTLRHELEQRQTVLVSQPESHRVIRIKNVLDHQRSNSHLASSSAGSYGSSSWGSEDVADTENNWEPFIGNGRRCLPGESDSCGDGGKARNARLSYPKGEC